MWRRIKEVMIELILMQIKAPKKLKKGTKGLRLEIPRLLS